jgi:hypothetical protein
MTTESTEEINDPAEVNGHAAEPTVTETSAPQESRLDQTGRMIKDTADRLFDRVRSSAKTRK